MRTLFFLLLLFLSASTHGQRFTISGYITDTETGEALIAASIVNLQTSQGTSANVHGFYSLTLNPDTVNLVCSYVGFKPKLVSILLTKDTVINIHLETDVLDEVVINASSKNSIHESARMSTFSIPVAQIKTLPVLLGETDILKALQLMPGVQSGNEGTTGLYVRGGGADQNLILLDGVPVYNVSHLFGFFSVFNNDAISHVSLTKGGFPARYGGRLSSVVDINMKEGNRKHFSGEGSIGLISSRLTVEGPIIKDKTSFMLSARRTYADLVAKPFVKKELRETGYYFYDLNMKVNHILNAENHLYISAYIGNDNAYASNRGSYSDQTSSFVSTDRFRLGWGNVITAFRWNHVYTPKLFSNVTATYSRYRFATSRKYQEESSSDDMPQQNISYGNEYYSGIKDVAAKIDFDYLPNPNHFIRFGFNSIYHEFSPGVYSYRATTDNGTTTDGKTTPSFETAVYFEDDWDVNDRIKVNAGVHASAFAVEDLWYYSLQPRISGRYLIRDEFSLKGSYSKMTQYLHLLTNVGVGLPTDLWVSSTARIRPQEASQVAFGVVRTLKTAYELSIEGYYKEMHNLIEYKDGASYLNIEEDWQDKIATRGRGESYGVELLLQKKIGSISGWLGYTLSKTSRKFEQLNFGQEFPYKYDRRHDINLAITRKWDHRRYLSLVWVYGTGNAITLPIAVFEGATNSFDSRYPTASEVIYYGDRNSYRMKSYHRLDLSFSWLKTKKWGERRWTIAIYNVYNRLNPFFIELGRDTNNNARFVEYSLFPVMPSFSYSFKF